MPEYVASLDRSLENGYQAWKVEYEPVAKGIEAPEHVENVSQRVTA